jgi:hypothetical protein
MRRERREKLGEPNAVASVETFHQPYTCWVYMPEVVHREG